MNTITPEMQQRWSEIAPILTIQSEQDYDNSVARLNELIDDIGTDESHPLYTLLDTLGILINAYEHQHYPVPDCSGSEALSYLMEEHSLSIADLPEIGSSETVASIISNQKEMSIKQIKAIAHRFNLSPAAFI